MVGVIEMRGKELKSIPMVSSFDYGDNEAIGNEDTMLTFFLLGN